MIGFNGAAFFRTRKHHKPPMSVRWPSKLQRSRVLSNAETWYDPRTWTWFGLRFNGAAFFRTRKPARLPPDTLTTISSFNGAAFFRTRKPALHWRRSTRSAMLQRSRVLSNAETGKILRPHHAASLASTEPRSFERGNHSLSGKSTATTIRFNGAAFFRTRKRQHDRRASRHFCASTEPRSFERGNTAPDPAGTAAHRCFNGAAFFRTRKPICQGQPRRAAGSFNGAAFFRTRKRLRSTARQPMPLLLQRSRVLSNAETPTASP